MIPVAPIERRMLLWSGAFIVTLSAWVGWLLWRNHRAASSQPFAKAFREMRDADDSASQTWQALHRAFDRTAGRVVQLESLPELFRRAPYLTPLRARIEQFFAASTERFFGAGPRANAISARALCDDLRRLEKRHER
jgi:mxaA protein